jgi:hypothetical protein
VLELYIGIYTKLVLKARIILYVLRHGAVDKKRKTIVTM